MADALKLRIEYRREHQKIALRNNVYHPDLNAGDRFAHVNDSKLHAVGASGIVNRPQLKTLEVNSLIKKAELKTAVSRDVYKIITSYLNTGQFVHLVYHAKLKALHKPLAHINAAEVKAANILVTAVKRFAATQTS